MNWSKYAIFTSLTRNLKNLWVDFHQTWYKVAPPGVDELIRFWARSAQRQRSMNWSKYAIFTSLTRNLKNLWVDFHQTWYMDAPPGVDELIRFWARSAQGQRSMNWSKYAIFTSLTRNLKNLWVDFHQTWYRGAPPGVDELIRFWARSAQHQRSMNLVSICYFYLVNAKSQEPRGGFSSNLVHGCTTRSR